MHVLLCFIVSIWSLYRLQVQRVKAWDCQLNGTISLMACQDFPSPHCKLILKDDVIEPNMLLRYNARINKTATSWLIGFPHAVSAATRSHVSAVALSVNSCDGVWSLPKTWCERCPVPLRRTGINSVFFFPYGGDWEMTQGCLDEIFMPIWNHSHRNGTGLLHWLKCVWWMMAVTNVL